MYHHENPIEKKSKIKEGWLARHQLTQHDLAPEMSSLVLKLQKFPFNKNLPKPWVPKHYFAAEVKGLGSDGLRYLAIGVIT